MNIIMLSLSHNDVRNSCLSILMQRLTEDSNPAIAAAATKAIYELKKQWEIHEGDSWRFTMNQYIMEQKGEGQETDNDSDTD